MSSFLIIWQKLKVFNMQILTGNKIYELYVCGFKCCTRMEICLLSIISLYFNTLSMQPTKKIDFRHFAKKRTLNQNFSTCILLYIIFFFKFAKLANTGPILYIPIYTLCTNWSIHHIIWYKFAVQILWSKITWNYRYIN